MDSPAQHVLAFDELRIAFDDRVLRPRPWTATQSAWAADLLLAAPPGPVLELCCGAGQIGLLAISRSPRSLVSIDLNPVACDFARRNAREAGFADLVEVRQGRLEEAVHADERFVLVIADPPWVRRAETGRYPEDPLLAIDGGDDGLDVARSCLAVAERHLVVGGSLIVQLGTLEQAEQLREETRATALELSEVRAGERGVLARLARLDRRAVPAPISGS